MKNLVCGAIITIILVAVVLGVAVLCGWIVATLLNVVLSQVGLGKISVWGGCSILATVQAIKWFLLQ